MKLVHSFTNFMNGKFFKNSFQEHLVELNDGTRIFLSEKDWKLHQKFHAKDDLSFVFEEFRTVTISRQRQGGYYYDRQLNAFASYCLFYKQLNSVSDLDIVLEPSVLEDWAKRYFTNWLDERRLRDLSKYSSPDSGSPVKFCVGEITN